MKLIIMSPEHRKEYSVDWLEVNTLVGNFVIMEGHAPMILTLKPDAPIIFWSNNHQETFTTPGGIAHITRIGTTLLVPQKL